VKFKCFSLKTYTSKLKTTYLHQVRLLIIIDCLFHQSYSVFFIECILITLCSKLQYIYKIDKAKLESVE